MRDGIILRPMTPEDVDATYHAASVALYESPEEQERLRNRSPEDVGRRKDRYRHFLRHDPDGARVADAANALVRDGLWVLSLFAVDKDYRNTGIGRALLDRALSYGAGTRGAVIASSSHPAALRRYARAGFNLHPTLSASGTGRHEASALASSTDLLLMRRLPAVGHDQGKVSPHSATASKHPR